MEVVVPVYVGGGATWALERHWERIDNWETEFAFEGDGVSGWGDAVVLLSAR